MTSATYRAVGLVRGSCGHAHRSVGAAVRCARRDARACASLGGGAYSDRVVRRADGQPLTEDERQEIVDAYAALEES